MHEFFLLLMAFASGLGLGAFFFAGLWWTVRRSLLARHPAALFASSLLVRTCVVVAGFYWIAGGRWPSLVACGLGFFAARLIVIWQTAPARDASAGEGIHAP